MASEDDAPAPILQLPPSPPSTAPSEPQTTSRGKRTKPPTRSELRDNQELKTKGKILDPITITFSGNDEKLRAFSSRPPVQVYRTSSEESKTLCAYTNIENQPKHREAEGLKILMKNAFQAIGAPDLSIDLTLNRLERHASWNTVKGPSSWISTLNRLHWAIRRAEFLTCESSRIGHRIHIAGISMKGLVAATVHAKYEMTYEITTSYGRGRTKEFTESYVEFHDVAIPVWVRDSCIPSDRSAITRDEFESSGADLWISVTELRRSDLRNVSQDLKFYEEILKKAHDYEWMCLGSIEKQYVTCVMPWDGKALHTEKRSRIVWSKSSPEKYVFDWSLRQWRLDPRLYALAVFRDRKARLVRLAARDKRKAERERRRVPKKAGKKVSKNVAAPGSSKRKRKHAVDEDGYDLGGLFLKSDPTNIEVWNLMMAAQSDKCSCSKRRNTRSGSAQL